MCIYAVHKYSLYFTHACFLPTTCASSHVGLKEKDVVVAFRREETVAPVETAEPEPTPEGNTHVHTHSVITNTLIVGNKGSGNTGVVVGISSSTGSITRIRKPHTEPLVQKLCVFSKHIL